MSNYLHNKKILIGITGGIAAYKTLELIRRLTESGADVKVVMTSAAKDFVTPISIHALSGNAVQQQTAMAHIELARWADVILVAPASANFIAKLANGIADDLLSTICSAANVALLVAPAMNQQMWLNAATQSNINLLKKREIVILGPANGSQACGETGPGRMLEAHELFTLIANHFAPNIFSGKHIVITAGPTQEHIDPVRYISNHSSGKMGYALANAALKLGASVTLISGPTNLSIRPQKNLNLINVISAADMHAQIVKIQQTMDIFIGCAAVADYTPVEPKLHKTKKQPVNFNLELKPTVDILAYVSSLPKPYRPFTVGFAAETADLLDNAQKKLISKNLDLLIANLVANGQVFNQDHNQVYVLRKNTTPMLIATCLKSTLAFEVLELIQAEFSQTDCAVGV